MQLSVAGLGIIFYSPWAVAHIGPESDYLQSSFQEDVDVTRHVNPGKIAAFCTGSPGEYELELTQSAPSLSRAEFQTRLALEVRDGCVHFRDLYELMAWDPEQPPEQVWPLANGFYRVTVVSSTPASGVLGDNQRITMHFERQDGPFQVHHRAVPMLCPE